MKEMRTKDNKPTTYCVYVWNDDGTILQETLFYPMYKYTLDDVFHELRGKEPNCMIYISRYSKICGEYVRIRHSDIYEWDGITWVGTY